MEEVEALIVNFLFSILEIDRSRCPMDERENNKWRWQKINIDKSQCLSQQDTSAWIGPFQSCPTKSSPNWVITKKRQNLNEWFENDHFLQTFNFFPPSYWPTYISYYHYRFHFALIRSMDETLYRLKILCKFHNRYY